MMDMGKLKLMMQLAPMQLAPMLSMMHMALKMQLAAVISMMQMVISMMQMVLKVHCRIPPTSLLSRKPQNDAGDAKLPAAAERALCMCPCVPHDAWRFAIRIFQ